MTIAPGVRLGPYEIVSRLGAGGMGEVWRAKDTRLDRCVAVKTLPAQFAQNAQLRLRFEREAKTISQLNHPNICTIYDVGDDYLVMELLEGESLADRVAKGPMPIEQVLKIGVEIATALDRAHRSGIVHRDLKPGNVMLTRTGAKLLDFGLAKTSTIVAGSTDATVQKSLTAEGTIVGTFQYMAPEQLEALEADSRTDIFALGCVLYEMATGRRAFEGKTKTSLIAAIVSAQPPPISSLLPLTPPALDHVVAKCLAKDPDERWQSAHDIAEELKWLRDSSASGVAAPVRAASVRRWKLAATSLAIVAILGAIAAAFALRRAPRDPHFALQLAMPAATHTAIFVHSVFSPDGDRVAFIAISADTGKSQMWVRDLSQRDAKPLPGTDGAMLPFWSPDGANIGFFADGKLKRIPSGGGPAQTICAVVEPNGGTWGSGGTILFANGAIGVVNRVDANGGTPVAVTKLQPHDEAHRWPVFLPDNDHFLFLSDASRTEDHWIRVGSLKTGQVRNLLRAVSNARYAAPGWLLFVRGGSLLAQKFDAPTQTLSGEPKVIADELVSNFDNHQFEFDASPNGRLLYRSAPDAAQMQWLDRQGNVIKTVGEPARIGEPRLSPDERHVCFEVRDADGRGDDLWLYDAVRNVTTRFTSDPAADVSRVWSADGKQIAFMSMRSGMGDVWVADVANPGGARLVVGAPAGVQPTSWSRDGTLLLNYTTDQSEIRMFRNGALQPYLDHGPFYGVASPDATHVAYVSDESGTTEVYVEAFPNHEGRRQMSIDGGTWPRWRADGKELFYVSRDQMLMSVDPTADSVPKPLFRLNGRAYDVSRDGQRFLVVTPLVERNREPLTVETSWLSRVAN